jgi:hypothetical protein
MQRTETMEVNTLASHEKPCFKRISWLSGIPYMETVNTLLSVKLLYFVMLCVECLIILNRLCIRIHSAINIVKNGVVSFKKCTFSL